MKGLGGRHRQLDPLVVVHGAIGVDKPLLGTPARLVLADPDADTNLELMILDLKWRRHDPADHLGNGLGIDQVVIGSSSTNSSPASLAKKRWWLRLRVIRSASWQRMASPWLWPKPSLTCLKLLRLQNSRQPGLGAAYLRLQPFHQAQAVGQAGEGISSCQLQYLLFRCWRRAISRLSRLLHTSR